MNKNSLKVFFTFSISLLSFISVAQSTVVNTETNGVVVYEATGVEGVVLVTTETPLKAKITEGWSLDQLKEMIVYIRLKMDEVTNTESALYYQDQLTLIEHRIKELESNK